MSRGYSRIVRAALCAAVLLLSNNIAFARIGNTSASVIGTTQTAINANFPGVIAKNLSSTKATAILAGLSAQELQDLAFAYGRVTSGNASGLASTISKYAPTQLARYNAAVVNANVGFSSIPSTMHDKMYVRAAGVSPAPSLDMTLQEIYLDFRTAPVGALSVEASIYMTSAYAAANLSAAFGAGYTLGSGISWLIQTYAPALDNAIGATLNSIISSLTTITSVMGIGRELDTLANYLDTTEPGIFFSDLYDSTGDLGDFGVLDDVLSYISTCVNPGDC